MRKLFGVTAAFWLFAPSLTGQQPGAFHPVVHHQVDRLNTYHRVIAVVPYVGTGKAGDPRHPKYVPAAPFAQRPVIAASTSTSAPTASSTASAHSGFLAFTHIPSDDNHMAVVEIIAADRATLAPILADKSIIAFEKGKVPPASIVTAVRAFNKNFILEHFGMPLP